MSAKDIGPHPFILARGGERVCAVCECPRIHFQHDGFSVQPPLPYGIVIYDEGADRDTDAISPYCWNGVK